MWISMLCILQPLPPLPTNTLRSYYIFASLFLPAFPLLVNDSKHLEVYWNAFLYHFDSTFLFLFHSFRFRLFDCCCSSSSSSNEANTCVRMATLTISVGSSPEDRSAHMILTLASSARRPYAAPQMLFPLILFFRFRSVAAVRLSREIRYYVGWNKYVKFYDFMPPFTFLYLRLCVLKYADINCECLTHIWASYFQINYITLIIYYRYLSLARAVEMYKCPILN